MLHDQTVPCGAHKLYAETSHTRESRGAECEKREEVLVQRRRLSFRSQEATSVCSLKLCGIYPATSYLICTKPFANCRVSMWRNLISRESGPNSGIPLPMRIGILVMINSWISPAARNT